jgi:bifunctional pyridoxal-dependent enzyme with beta-cystathionase and maltose regulon repressor activities
MSNYDFSQPLSRKNSWKWEYESIVDGHRVLPMSVADTDFISPREATYLLWVDFRGTVWTQNEIQRFLVEDAGIGVNRGDSFGASGTGFVRINSAVPESRIDEAIQRLRNAF